MNDFISIPSNPTPKTGWVKHLETADGARLRTAFFSAERARGNVVLLNGRTEFIEKYFEVIEDLRRRGLNVATMDWRGQGLSSRALANSEKGHIDDFSTYVRDLKQFIAEIAEPNFTDGPRLLMTHSMGGMPALMMLAEGGRRFDRAVLCAPLTRLAMPGYMLILARGLASAFTGLGGGELAVAGVKEGSHDFKDNALTSDENRHKRFRALQLAAPAACLTAPTYGWLRAAFKAVDDIHQPGRLSGIQTPVLIISAEHDDLVDSHDHRALADAYDKIDCITVEGALHEILMERDDLRAQYWAHFDRFVAPVFDGVA